MGLIPVKKTRIYEEVIEQIKSLIESGELEPVNRIPPERDLAEKLGVSRSAVREALSVLAAAGTVEIRPGSGAYVRQISPSDFNQQLALSLLSERESLLDLLEVRKIIEVEAARLAAQRADSEDLRVLEDAYYRMESEVGDRRLGAEEDFAFHYFLARATHNKALMRVMNTLSDLFRRSLAQTRAQSLAVPGRPEAILQEHRRILDSVTVGEPDQAAAAMREHLENMRAKIKAADPS